VTPTVHDDRRVEVAVLFIWVEIWDATSGQETLILKQHTDAVTSVAFSVGEKRLALGSRDHTVKATARGRKNSGWNSGHLLSCGQRRTSIDKESTANIHDSWLLAPPALEMSHNELPRPPASTDTSRTRRMPARSHEASHQCEAIAPGETP
jgi:WD40 repeat protein